MPLRKALIEAPLSTGLNEEIDTRSLVVTGAEVMQNCVAGKNGSIRKRAGSKQLTNIMSGGAYSAGFAGFTMTEFAAVRGMNYGHRSLLFDGYTFSEYSDKNATWRLIDSAPEAVATDRIPVSASPILTNYGVVSTDIDYYPALNFYVCGYFFVNLTGTNVSVEVSIIDASNGAVIQSTTIATFASSPPGTQVKVIVNGNTAILAYTGNPLTIQLSKIDLTNIPAGWSSPVPFDSPDSVFDMASMPGSARFVLGYAKGGTTVYYQLVNATTFAIIHTFTHAPTAAGNPLEVTVWAKDAEWCWIAYNVVSGAGRTVEAWAFNDTGFAQINPVFLGSDTWTGAGGSQMGIARKSATDAYIIWSQVNGALTTPPEIYSVNSIQVTAGGGGATVGSGGGGTTA